MSAAIQVAKIAEAAAVIALWRSCALLAGQPHAERMFYCASDRSHSQIFVQHDTQGKIIGTVFAGHDGHRGWMGMLGVDPARRGENIGRELVEHAEGWLRRQGMDKTLLMIPKSLPQAGKFFEHLGFTDSGSIAMEQKRPVKRGRLPSNVRRAALRDKEIAVGLWDQCGLLRNYHTPRRYIDLALNGSQSTLLVGTGMDGGIESSALAGHNGIFGCMYFVASNPAKRGKGLGVTIVKAAETWLKGRGIDQITLLVRKTNPVVPFYAKLGYQEMPVAVLEKRLRPVEPNALRL